jgi:cytochrome c biogenesis protein CcmG/thiol:disulfide interchange protein DsbE
MSRARRVLLVVVILAALFLLATPYLHAAKGGGAPAVGQAAPLFTSTNLAGQPVALSAFRGHRVILNFWASWCVPCRSEFPVLQQLLGRHPDVVVLGVVFNDSDGPAHSFMQAEGATWPGVRDPKSQIADAYDVHAKPGIPVSVAIDATGHIRAYQLGPLTDQAAADTFLATAGPA